MKYLLSIFLLFSLSHSSDAKYNMGKSIYEQTCISCHAEDGSAQTSMRLLVMPRALTKTILTEEQSYQIIKKGTHYWGSAADIMPSFESVYKENELRSVAHYITKTFKPDAQAKIDKLYAEVDSIPKDKEMKMLAVGEKAFKRTCLWCHGKTAQGNGEATRNPEMSIFPYDLTKTLLTKKQMFLYIKYGGKYWGSAKDDMPAWSPKYDDYTIKSIIKYIEETLKK